MSGRRTDPEAADGDGSVMDYLMEKYKDLVRRKARLMYLFRARIRRI